MPPSCAASRRHRAHAPTEAQVLALESLGRHYVADRVILDQLLSLFSQTHRPPVQVAIAGILIRADRRAIASPQLALTLQKDRLPSAAGDSIIDALIRVLSSP
jgi:hypothetical protein